MNVNNQSLHVLEVWGDFACFSFPAFKVERYSYPCPTPSAARGIYDGIFWKNSTCDDPNAPKESRFYWQIHRIELLTLPSYIALRRNEVKDKAPSDRTIKQWMKGSKPPEPIWADGVGSDQKGRTQRQTMALRNPRYRLTASIHPYPKYRSQLKSFNQQYLRRARKGKCHAQAFFGCKEFVSFFRHVESLEEEPKPVDYNQHLGLMLYDVFDLSVQNNSHAKASVSVFDAKIVNGVLEVPEYESPLVLKPERRAS